MLDQISVFKGILPEPVGVSTWQEALAHIKSDKYRDAVGKARTIKDATAYREFKKRLPSITFCGQFKNPRNRNNIISATGFIIPDLDHLPDVESVFVALEQDENIWFAFRSPSGEGIKCSVRAQGIASDDDIKRLYEAVERYFADVYGIKIDPACKDISRLTFVSHDPELFINPSPQFFDIERWAKKQAHAHTIPPPQVTNNGWKGKYGKKVLESCCAAIAGSQPGEQHHTRLRMARLVGGYIPEYIPEETAMACLEAAVVESGAKRVPEAMKTVADGLKNGMANPIQIEPKSTSRPQDDDDKYYFDESLSSDEVACSQMKSLVANVVSVKSPCSQDVVTLKSLEVTSGGPDSRPLAYSLAHLIEEWITNSTGSFTVDQIDREFCLNTRTEKKNRTVILLRLEKKLIIKKDKQTKGKYHILDTKIDFLDLDTAEEDEFPIKLPFKIHEYVQIPPHGLIVLAGSTNAGKTAFFLNTLRLNLTQTYEKLYLMSEMGSAEYKTRLLQFGESLDQWKAVKAASKSYGFDGIVQHHNPHGLTCIDFLEEVEGEYFKIASSIRDIYDSLGNGVCMIAIQKKTDGTYARGGQATAEKARLYMALDYLATQNNAIVCALKMVKVKHFLNRNLQNHEIHFRIEHGCRMTPLTDWMPCSKINREAMICEYEGRPLEIAFVTESGKMVKVNGSQIQQWQESFPNVKIMAELSRISRDSTTKPFLKDKGYFFQLAGILGKKNEGKV